jgi:Zn finger protein HypA/HybF involved in hydrogenase expression
VHEYSIAMGLVQMALRYCRRPPGDGGQPARRSAAAGRAGYARAGIRAGGAGTACEGALLEQELVPCRLRCPSCAVEWTAAKPDFRCRTCGWPAVLLSGNELQMESIEVEDEEQASTR